MAAHSGTSRDKTYAGCRHNKLKWVLVVLL